MTQLLFRHNNGNAKCINAYIYKEYFQDNEIVSLIKNTNQQNVRFILDNIKSKIYPTINEKQYNMASASSTSARSLFIESKMRLADRVQVNVNNIASLARQIQRGSKSSEILTHAARNFAQQEHGLETMESGLKKLALIATHLEYQMDAIDKNSAMLEQVTEQVRSMQR